MISCTTQIVDSTLLLDTCLNDIGVAAARRLAVDLEGVNLCRNGRVSIVQLFNQASGTIWLVDVTILGADAFTHVGPNGKSLSGVLEDPATIKIFFDVRSDSDALYNLYGITLANVYDLQLLEVAVRRSNLKKVRFLCGLGKTIDTYLNPSPEWKRIKEAGAALFFPDKGGSWDVIEHRPLDERVVQYAAQDVSLLFQLEAVMETRIGVWGTDWKARIFSVSMNRVKEAHREVYQCGRERAIAPNL